MATSIKSAKLTVRVTEDITLNGRKLGNTNKHEIAGINEISERILTVPTDQITVLSSSSGLGAGTFLSSSIKYVRFTNLDDTNHIRLTFMSESAGTTKNKTVFKLEPERSFIICNDQYSGSGIGTAFDSFQSYTNIKAKADTAAVDMEIFVATT